MLLILLTADNKNRFVIWNYRIIILDAETSQWQKRLGGIAQPFPAFCVVQMR